jgi:nucleolar protein 4
MGPQRKRQRISSNGTSAATTNDEFSADGSNTDAEEGLHAGTTPTKRSLFVRSLSSTATTETLTQYFSQSFPIKHATVVLDPVTKQSKGYGFVTFVDAEDAKRRKRIQWKIVREPED